MVGLCLVAVFAIAAVTASSASALPEWGKCEAKAGGKYSDANCTVKAKKGSGTFEWKKGSEVGKVQFAGGNVGSGGVLTTYLRFCLDESEKVLENSRVTRANCAAKGGTQHFEPGDPEAEPIFVECTSETNNGQSDGSKSLKNVKVKFKGCALFGAFPCSNTEVAGEIQVNELKGSLGYINKAAKEVGVLLEPVSKHGAFAHFTCSGLADTTVGVGNSKEGTYYLPEGKGGYDGVISPITPVNTMTHSFTQVYTINPETAENIPNKFDGKHLDLLEDFQVPPSNPAHGSMWSPAGEEITNVNYLCKHHEVIPIECKPETEEGEIKA